ncbi:MAG TPA: hypothetical protein VIS99_13685 [Terrimicrobiaceae bacterium]
MVASVVLLAERYLTIHHRNSVAWLYNPIRFARWRVLATSFRQRTEFLKKLSLTLVFAFTSYAQQARYRSGRLWRMGAALGVLAFT